ncbi:MAG: hypothetical protein Q9165_004653 [Trypethelium subeluteriae]
MAVFVESPPEESLAQNESKSQEKGYPLPTSSTSLQLRERSPSGVSAFNYLASVPRSLSLVGFANDLYCSFLIDSYWASSASDDYAATNRTWFIACLTKDRAHSTSSLALQALAMAYFGRKHHQQHIVFNSSALYGQALRALSGDIQNPNKVRSFDTLAAVTSLSLFEYCAGTTPTAHIRHTSALSHIVELRGPASFTKYPEKAILQTQRALILIQALVLRKRSFLGNPEWLALHEEDAADDPPQTPLDAPFTSLLAIFAILPGVVEDVETIHQQRVSASMGFGTVDETLFSTTADSMTSVLSSLHDWRQTYSSVFATHCWKAPSLGLSCDSDGSIFPTVFWYTSLEAANLVTLHATLQLLATEQSHILHNPSYSTSIPAYLSAKYYKTQAFEDHLPTVVPLAHVIMRNVEYHLQPAHANSGAFYIMFPARLAYTALRRERRESVWLRRVIERVADQGALEIARGILGDDLVEAARRDAGSRMLELA